MNDAEIIGAVEIGTAKSVAVIGHIANGQSLNIVGVGQARTQGIKKGEVVDLKAASEGIQAAVMAAEDSAEVSLTSVYLGLTGSHLEGFFNEATVNVASTDNTVSQDDILRVTQEAKAKQIGQDRVYIHHIQNPFKLDGRVVSNPLGMQGEKLGVGYWSVHGDTHKIRDYIQIVNGFGLKVDDVILASVASGAMVADESEKHNGVLVIDIGRGTTDFAVYKNGYVLQTGVVPIGGDHITNDLSLGLRIDRIQAERLKVEFGSALEDPESPEKVWIEPENNAGKRSIRRNAMYQIIHARIRELFELIQKQITRTDLSSLAAGAIITGGSSRLLKIDEVASEVLGLSARLGDNPHWTSEELRDPEFSTVLGLLHYALRAREKHASLRVRKDGLLNKVAKIFTLG